MAFYRYTVIKNGISSNVWTSDFSDENYYEPSFGLPERKKLKKDLLPEEMPFVISEEDIEITPATDTTDAIVATQVTLKRTYDVQIEDITDEIRRRDLDLFTDQKMQEVEEQIFDLLAPMEATTHLMIVSRLMYTALNLSENQTPQEINESKTRLASYISLMDQIQQMRVNRDAAIESKKVELGLT